MLATALTVIALLGGTGTITLPGEARANEVAEEVVKLKTDINAQLAQSWEAQQQIHDSQYRTILRNDLARTQGDLRAIDQEIERLNMLPDYLGRELNAEEQWNLDSLRQTWNLLKEDEQAILEELGR